MKALFALLFTLWPIVGYAYGTFFLTDTQGIQHEVSMQMMLVEHGQLLPDGIYLTPVGTNVTVKGGQVILNANVNPLSNSLVNQGNPSNPSPVNTGNQGITSNPSPVNTGNQGIISNTSPVNEGNQGNSSNTSPVNTGNQGNTANTSTVNTGNQGNTANTSSINTGNQGNLVPMHPLQGMPPPVVQQRVNTNTPTMSVQPGINTIYSPPPNPNSPTMNQVGPTAPSQQPGAPGL